ncbi:hypothetical protein NJB1907f44_36890 [Mycobacterium marinum]|uniref:hypothetical protein n=1 Tax=Mycobacterium marinum TaxID=1781 RepID=UPI000E3B6B70|nr:hypothetical protein [Mycobacterium marinum]RFZ30533.1 hypothetical protein KST_05131 [Mycobacterium marinum]GJN95803.1 hypothetical protein NJB1907f34b_02450 [Mycobacterium marinum]GJO06533.1 hypothetical protein NJB1808e29_35820 [Mycobacterium marinum]GJO12003.1 hypothetical protein NJB1907E11_04770 [Mycobacterium marinum]GJO12690.1 hypothetical protein NJB1728e18_00110 [Mycobacterium marinum]
MSFSDGLGVLKLECPQGHPVGRILKEAAHQSVQFDPGAQVGPRRFWPDEDGQGQFKAHCRYCDKPVGDSIATLQNKYNELLVDPAQMYATATVPYL